MHMLVKRRRVDGSNSQRQALNLGVREKDARMGRQVVINDVAREVDERSWPPRAALGSIVRHNARREVVGSILRDFFRKVKGSFPIVVA